MPDAGDRADLIAYPRFAERAAIHAARTSFAEKVACVIDTVVPFGPANVTT